MSVSLRGFAADRAPIAQAEVHQPADDKVQMKVQNCASLTARGRYRNVEAREDLLEDVVRRGD
jgi:ribosomal protein S3AE